VTLPTSWSSWRPTPASTTPIRPTCLRGGCLTGPAHSGVELHGFLSYLIKCNLEEVEYTVFGYKAKQVRDNIHAYDVVSFAERFIEAPRAGAVYNLGGGKGNAISMLEAFALSEEVTGKPMRWRYDEKNREGDHICYYSDLRHMQADYPGWGITRDLQTIFEEIADSWSERLRAQAA
jgi:CDP-paratose 2-epimerase